MNASMWLGLFAIGFLTGLRAMTPIAVICWMTVLGRVPAAAGWMRFAGSRISVGVFSVAALGELVGDKLPNAPARTKAPGLLARIIFGALCAAILATSAGYSLVGGALLGAVGAVAGTFGGWFARTRIVAALRCPDLPIALVEDAIAVGGSILVCSLFAR
jgi:uncharacterized membrane protein